MTNEASSNIASRDDSMPKNQEITPKKSLNISTVLAFSFLIFIGLLTAFLYFRTLTLDTQVSTITKNIAEKQASIDKLKADPKVRAAEIFALNKSSIEKTIASSNAANYVRELERIHAEESNITFNGFLYSAGKVTSSVTAFKGIDDDAVRKIISLIRGYRDGSTNSASGTIVKLDLKPITNVVGKTDKRSISVEFNAQ